jgi:hypothetical protein
MTARTRAAGTLGLTLALLGTAGCTNALYFYETGKVSLTLEGRPDSTQPVQGNLGFKQRTAVVAPPKADGDSAGMLASFRFSKLPGLWQATEQGRSFFGPIDIRTALITGDAVPDDPGAQKMAARAVAAEAIPSKGELVDEAIANATARGRMGELEPLLGVPGAELSDEQISDLGKATGLHSYYDAEFHDAIRARLGR